MTWIHWADLVVILIARFVDLRFIIILTLNLHFSAMSPRRSRLELYLDVLRLANDGVRTPAEMMGRVGLPKGQLHQIINSAVSQGLVREVGGGSDLPERCYEITEKGANVLRYFSKVEDIEEISPVTRTY